MTEEHAYVLALRVTHTSGYRVLEVRRAWSAAVSWQVEAEDRGRRDSPMQMQGRSPQPNRSQPR